MSNYRYSFIVPTLGRVHELKALLRSLEAQTCRDYEIIIVDQNEHACVQTLCKNHERVKYVHSERKGLSLARNAGIKNAGGDYLVFPDDDATLKSDFLEKANEFITNLPHISIFSGIVMTLEEKKPFSRYMDFTSEEFTYRKFDKFMSTTMIIDKKVFDIIGGFDEEMGVGARWGGSEETDLLFRAFEAGLRAYYSPALVAYHPEADFSKMSFRKAILKGYSYGLGRGALFRKLIRRSNQWWILSQWLLSLLKSVGGLSTSFISGHGKDFCRHCGALLGRIVGFVSSDSICSSKLKVSKIS